MTTKAKYERKKEMFMIKEAANEIFKIVKALDDLDENTKDELMSKAQHIANFVDHLDSKQANLLANMRNLIVDWDCID